MRQLATCQISILAAAVALAFPQSALAAEGEVADDGAITVTATRIPQAVEEVPATVTVISDEKIADELASDVRDMIRFEPGVSVRRAPSRFTAAFSSTGRGGNESFNIRGIEGNRVLIQVDGIRVPDGFSFGAQSAGRGDFVDLGVVKSVEILRGPASALYGSDGLAGAVSFITSDPADLLKDGRAFAGMLRAGYDSADNEFSETVIGATASGQFSILGAYTRRDGKELENNAAASAIRDVPDSRRTAPNPQDTASNAALGKLVWQPDAHNRIRLTVDHLDARTSTNVLSGRSTPPNPPAVLSSTAVLDLQARDTTRRDRVSLDWRRENDGVVDFLQLSLYWQDGKNRQFSAEDRNTALDRTRINTFENRVLGGAFEARSSFAIGSIEHTLLYGGDYSVTRQKGLRDGTVPTPPDVFPTRAFPVTDFTLSGLYLADQIVIGDGKLRLFPALRFDYYKISPRQDPLLPAFFTGSGQDGSKLSPKFGAVAKITDKWSVFGNYARGFQAPSPIEINQFFDNPSAFPFSYRTLRNPDLRPETSETFEGGLRLNSKAVDVSVTAFSGRYRDFISQVQVGGTGTVANPVQFQYQNLNRVKVEGIEGRVEFRSGNGITANLAIAYAKGDQFDAANAKTPLQTVDPLRLVVGLGYRAPSGKFGGQIAMTHGARKEENRVLGLCTPACFRPDSYTILDATAFVKLSEAFTLRAGLFNLLDKRYIEYADVRGLANTSLITDAFTQPGRNFSVSLTARY
jgi:hemoglobin/transferrin/lactoferrin receptor protein